MCERKPHPCEDGGLSKGQRKTTRSKGGNREPLGSNNSSGSTSDAFEPGWLGGVKTVRFRKHFQVGLAALANGLMCGGGKAGGPNMTSRL